MGRRGWTNVEVPDGWLQVNRGPRPRSEKWPLQTGPRSAAPPSKPVPRQPRAVHHTQQPKHQPVLRTSGLRPFTDPATKVSDAKERVIKLERALAAMEGIDGSEVDAIREALERAKKAAQSPPVETQIRDCEQFLVRARAHLEAIDAQRATVVASIEEGSKRLESLKVVQQKQPPQVPDTSSEVQRLQALVAQLQSQLVQVQGPSPMTVEIPTSTRSIARRFRALLRRGDAAMGVGWSTRPPVSDHGRQAGGSGRISQLIIQGAQEWHGVQAEQTTVGPGPCMLLSTVGLMVQ